MLHARVHGHHSYTIRLRPGGLHVSYPNTLKHVSEMPLLEKGWVYLKTANKQDLWSGLWTVTGFRDDRKSMDKNVRKFY